jgi:hypothetical protein
VKIPLIPLLVQQLVHPFHPQRCDIELAAAKTPHERIVLQGQIALRTGISAILADRGRD